MKDKFTCDECGLQCPDYAKVKDNDRTICSPCVLLTEKEIELIHNMGKGNKGEFTKQGLATIRDLEKTYPPGHTRDRMVYGKWVAAFDNDGE